MDLLDKIRIGTVHFGKTYGIGNPNGELLSDQNLSNFFDECIKKNIYKIDSANDYGIAHKRINSCFSKNFEHKINLSTKISLRSYSTNFKNLENQIEVELEKIKSIFRIDQVKDILIHNGDDFLSLKSSYINKIKKTVKQHFPRSNFGLSVYSIECLKDNNIRTFDLIQFPCSYADQRFKRAFVKRDFEGKKQARSIFLQGLLLMEKDELHQYFKKYVRYFTQFEELCKIKNISKIDMCLGFVILNPLIDEVVIGVQNISQLRDLINSVKRLEASAQSDFEFESIFPENDQLILPYNWRLGS